MDVLNNHNPESGRSKRNEESGVLDFRDSLSRWWLLLPLSVFSCCLVCITDLCSNSHSYLCSHLDVAAKYELLKEEKIKDRSRVMQVLLSLSMATGFCSVCKTFPRLPRDLPKEHSQPSVF